MNSPAFSSLTPQSGSLYAYQWYCFSQFYNTKASFEVLQTKIPFSASGEELGSATE
jgi:hypothetical protein